MNHEFPVIVERAQILILEGYICAPPCPTLYG